MKWKKFLFGDIHYKNELADGNQEVEFKLKGGLMPNLGLLLVLFGLFGYYLDRRANEYYYCYSYFFYGVGSVFVDNHKICY